MWRERPRWWLIFAVFALGVTVWITCDLLQAARMRDQLIRERDEINERLEKVESRMGAYESWPALQK